MEFAGVATQELTLSTSSPLDEKELVKQAIDIVDLVGSHIPLRRQGRNYVGLCPWHDDSRPSLQVNPERQSFKCWVCDIGGDVFSFIMQIEGVEFREALSMLADRAGITLTRRRSPSQGPAQQTSDGAAGPVPVAGEAKRTLYRAMAWAETEYHKCLLESPEGEPARKYLTERGITAETIEQFHLGFCPNQRDWMLRRVQGDPSRVKTLETIGLLARPQEGGSPYDRFRGRVLFSIRDTQARPVGLGGRILPESGAKSPAKYINSPETPLFSKSNLLYGLDVARDSLRKSRRALVMEGYTDVIVAHQYGFRDAVAVLGTALGERHIRILKRFADRIVLVLDGDEAGQRRANEVLELFVGQQADLQILTLPAGSDPCEFLQTHGAEAFTKLIETGAVDALDHAFQTATAGLDLNGDVDAVDRALEQLLSIIAKAPRLAAGTDTQHRNREWKILSKLAMRFRLPEESIRQRLKELRRRAARRRPVPRPEKVAPATDPGFVSDEEAPDEAALEPGAMGKATLAEQLPIALIHRELLEVLMANPACFAAIREQIEPRWFGPPVCRQIYETLCRLQDRGEVPDFARLMLEFDDPAIKGLLVELDESWLAKGERESTPQALIANLITTFHRQEAEKQRIAQLAALRDAGLDDSQKDSLLETIVRQARNRQGISEPKEGPGYPDPGDRP